MPTYEYECSRCGERFERFQSFSDRPVRRCPACGGKVRRLLGAGAAVIVKGGSAPACPLGRACSNPDAPCRFRPPEQ